MTKVLVGLSLVVVVGLGMWAYLSQGKVNTLIAERVGHTRTCVNNVYYLLFPNGASVEYKENGSIRNCNE